MSNQASQAPVRSLSKSLQNVHFPISRQALLAQYGHVQIQMVHGPILTLERALANIVQPSFRSLSDLVVAVGEYRHLDSTIDF